MTLIWSAAKFIRTKMPKSLFAFDFDHTIIDDNSDTAVVQLLGHNDVPEEIKSLYRTDGWTAYMQGIFKLLQNCNTSQEEITEFITKLKPVKGFVELIKALGGLDNDLVIISDSNSYFIDSWLMYHGLQQQFLRVFTNPARFEDGLLRISMYHLQDYCDLSTKNLCKGQILDDFIRSQAVKQIVYDRVFYCGDGKNDLCPILRLRNTDVAYVRNKYKCAEMVEKCKKGALLDKNYEPYVIRAKVVFWETGKDILEHWEQQNNTS